MSARVHLVVQQVEAIGRFLLGLGVQRLLEPPELRWSCQAHANLPPLGSSRRTPNQGAFPPRRFCCPAGPNGTMRPSDTHRGSRRQSGSESRDPSPRWASRVAPCSVPTCHAHYPGERSPPSSVGCSDAIQRPSLFFRQVGAHDFPFEACSGFTRVAARRLADPPTVGPCPESFSDSVTLLAASVATGVHRQLPGPDFHRQETQHLFTAHMRRVQLRGGARRPHARRTFCTLSRAVEGANEADGPLSSL